MSGDCASSDDDQDTVMLEEEPNSPLKPLNRAKQILIIKKEIAKGDKHVVKVDRRGNPYGKGAEFLANDVKSFAKDLNPLYGWGNQPMKDKMRFFERVAAGITWYWTYCNGVCFGVGLDFLSCWCSRCLHAVLDVSVLVKMSIY